MNAEAIAGLGLIALETLKAILDELGIDRSTIMTGTDAVEAVRRRVLELRSEGD